MRYVDEFRDAELGRAVAAEIASTVDAGRHYKVMEVCGGHTHSIYKYGVDDAGARSDVEASLVGPVRAGDRLLVHAGVAIAPLVAEVRG